MGNNKDISDAGVVEIFTDGACSGNPGPGGWGALLRYGRHEKRLQGFSPSTTNNRMELLGAIRALEALKRPCRVILTTDSSYLKNGITTWIHSWKNRSWKRAGGKAVKNEDLWRLLDKLAGRHHIEWRWVKGHSGHEENEIVDKLATSAIEMGMEGLMEPDPLGELNSNKSSTKGLLKDLER